MNVVIAHSAALCSVERQPGDHFELELLPIVAAGWPATISGSGEVRTTRGTRTMLPPRRLQEVS